METRAADPMRYLFAAALLMACGPSRLDVETGGVRQAVDILLRPCGIARRKARRRTRSAKPRRLLCRCLVELPQSLFNGLSYLWPAVGKGLRHVPQNRASIRILETSEPRSPQI